MHRCESAGRFRVSLRVLHEPEPMRVQIHGHHDVFLVNADGSPMTDVDGNPKVAEHAPFVDTDAPFEGELCAHELQWLQGTPGRDWPRHYEWTVEELAASAPKRQR